MKTWIFVGGAALIVYLIVRGSSSASASPTSNGTGATSGDQSTSGTVNVGSGAGGSTSVVDNLWNALQNGWQSLTVPTNTN